MTEFMSWELKPNKLDKKIVIQNNYFNDIQISYNVVHMNDIPILYWKFDHLDEIYDISYLVLKDNNIEIEDYFKNSINIIYDQLNFIILQNNETYKNNINSKDLEFLISFKTLLK